ncbi:MAG TPA: DUF4097 family beta strand repeat-containing protein [Gemmatimonadaceae bacterium]|nr:DUF4097 family beta strand repeat-containing protein [Gemmatimonadaceae bacterium]
MSPIRPRLAALCVALGLVALAASARAQEATDFRWAKALQSGSRVRLNNVNGSVTVSAAAGNEVEVVGRRRRGSAEDIRVQVVETSEGIVACVVWRGDECDESGYHGRNRRGWDDDDRRSGRMDLEVRVPRGLHVHAGSVSGSVAVSGVEGEVRASSVSGDVRVVGIRAPSLSASSVSGDIEARVDALTGSGDLRFSSVSGDVVAELPKDFAADLRMSTVSGEIDSSFPITLQGRTNSRSIEGRIGEGGRRLTVSTVSGDLTLRVRQ